jgi:membrane protease YdiL (CAAX protease family)
MLILSKGKISTYGFKMARNIQLKRIILLSLGIGIIGALIQFHLPMEEPGFEENFSFIQTVIFIWIYASICEEVLTRGLIQGYLAPLTKYGVTVFKLRISFPVLISALFFASMHIMLLTMNMDGTAVFNIVSFAFILGIIAGYYREKTGSLIPAIIVHMLFNVGGSCAGLLIELF